MPGYYDIVLGLIPLVLVGITASLLGFGLELSTAVPAASLAAVGVIVHAMFVRAPVAVPRERKAQHSRTEFQSAD